MNLAGSISSRGDVHDQDEHKVLVKMIFGGFGVCVVHPRSTYYRVHVVGGHSFKVGLFRVLALFTVQMGVPSLVHGTTGRLADLLSNLFFEHVKAALDGELPLG